MSSMQQIGLSLPWHAYIAIVFERSLHDERLQDLLLIASWIGASIVLPDGGVAFDCLLRVPAVRMSRGRPCANYQLMCRT